MGEPPRGPVAAAASGCCCGLSSGYGQKGEKKEVGDILTMKTGLSPRHHQPLGQEKQPPPWVPFVVSPVFQEPS